MFNIRKGLVKSVLYDRKGRACSALKTDSIGLGLRLKNDREAMLFRSFCKYPCGYFPVLDRGLILLTSVGSSSYIDNFRSWRKNNWPALTCLAKILRVLFENGLSVSYMSHISIYQWSSLPKQWGSLQIGRRLYMGLENLKRGIVDFIQQTTNG